jgi:tripartite-type tricarboxylate transporter receptor subunit TctC
VRDRRKLALRLFVLALAAAAPAAAEEPYPTRPITMLIPFAPGGASDFVGRVLQPALVEALGQQVIVENKPGAAGNIALAATAHAAPDGYTIFLGNIGTLAINPSVFGKSLAVDPLKDFAPITLVAETPDILVANPAFPPSTVKEFVEYVKKQPGEISFASPGSGSANRLEMELLRGEAGLDMIHVPYKGGAGQAVTDLLGGHVKVMFTTLSSALPHIRSAKLKPIAVTTAQRVASLPDVPTMGEAGYPHFVSSSWQGMVAPAGTPPNTVRTLYAALVKALAQDEVRQHLANGGADPLTSRSPEEFAEFLAAETKRWSRIVKESGATAD